MGYRFGVAAFAAALAYVVVQIGQVVGLLRFPWDEILIYGTSLCIVVPFVLEMLAFHYTTAPDRRFWTHAALIFTVMYAIFVTTNYVVQLATVIPAKLAHAVEEVRLLDQTPHSLFWDFDAMGYICMGLATLFAIAAVSRTGSERRLRIALIAHTAVTPLIAIVYFYPRYSPTLLLLGFPWGVTAPLFMLLLALELRRRDSITAG
jgi:hypothetical protein